MKNASAIEPGQGDDKASTKDRPSPTALDHQHHDHVAGHSLPPRGRAGNGAHCLVCSATLNPNRASRQQRYCSSACRQRAFRAKKWVRRYKIPDPLRSAWNNRFASTACRAGFGDLAPVEILGRAFRWPGSARPERAAVIRNIIDREIGGAAS
jgi:hypothetical protein